jgi:hypothetical protein
MYIQAKDLKEAEDIAHDMKEILGDNGITCDYDVEEDLEGE